MKLKPALTVAIALIAFLFSLGASSKRELQRRFRERVPEIQSLKSDGVVGEAWDGYLDAVKGRLEKKERRLIDEENDDRRELYELIADDEKTRPALVAERNAVRNWRSARPGEYFKEKSGDWKQKPRNNKDR